MQCFEFLTLPERASRSGLVAVMPSRARKITSGQYKSSPSPRRRPLLLFSSSIHQRSPQPQYICPSILHFKSKQLHDFQSNLSSKTVRMPPKGAAEKKPAAAKAPAQKAPAEKKDAGKKTAATGDKKKRTKTRKETYSSYIYKGTIPTCHLHIALFSPRLPR